MKETRFKQTEIGEIPEDWDIKKISDFTQIITGGTPSTLHPEYWGGNIKWMNSGELNYKIINNVQGRITSDGLENSSTHILPKNCVLIGLAGQGKTRGTAAFSNISLCTNQSIAAILPSRTYNSLYLYYFMDNQYDNLRLLSSGDGGRGGLNKTILNNFQIILPRDKDEQYLIASYLQDIDTLISSLEKLIEKKKNIKQGTMQQLLTGKKRLPGFAKSDKYKQTEIGEIPEDWEVTTLETISKYRKETEMTSKLDNNNYVGTEQMLSNKAGIYKNKNKIIQNRVNTYKANDVLISNIRPYLKKIWFANCYGGCSSDVLVFQLNSQKLISPFLFYILSDDNFFSFMMDGSIGTKMPRGDKKLIMSYPCCFPNNKNEQKAIVQILKDMDKEIEVLYTKLEKYRSVKQGMMQQLLTGKIRLINSQI